MPRHFGFAAAAAFTFDLGTGQLQTSALRHRLDERNWAAAARELRHWVYGEGKVCPACWLAARPRCGCCSAVPDSEKPLAMSADRSSGGSVCRLAPIAGWRSPRALLSSQPSPESSKTSSKQLPPYCDE
ncbi:glycoside hydrolase family protein [Aquabacterium sp. A7-Y]|uniref:glycoside hydrolase family protein n=1 Tax=Aquabacterium sp. A7-Y TaxID=1349605 RepID=UPI0039FBE2E5